MTKYELRSGMFRIPEGTEHTRLHAEAAEAMYQGIVSLARRVLHWQGVVTTVEGMENIPAYGGALLAMNHTGYYDFLFGSMPAHLRGRRLVRFMAKKEIFDVPVVGRFMRGMKHVPVDRARGAGAVDAAVEHLNAGHLVSIFPEATISRSFELKEFKNGAARIAAAAEVPLIPMICWGSQRIWTKGGKKNLGRNHLPVHVKVGAPIELTGDVAADMERLKSAMQALLDQVRADYDRDHGPFEDGLAWRPAANGGVAPTLAEADRMDAADKAEKARKRKKKAEHKTAKELRKADDRLAKKANRQLRRLSRLGRKEQA